MGKKTPKEIEEKVRELLDIGETIRAAADKTGVSTCVVFRIKEDMKREDEIPLALWEEWDKLHRKYGQTVVAR